MKIIVVSPHPDDETLGSGGALLKYKAQGSDIYWINITNMKEEYGYKAEEVLRKLQQIEQVKEAYQFDGYFDLGLQPASLEKYNSSDIIRKISRIFEEIEPNVVILPNPSDIHSDHKRVFDWCFSCTKVFRYPYIDTILTMEILSETDFGNVNGNFIPDYFVDITDSFSKKLEIIKLYKDEIGKHPFPRSEEGLEAIAKLRGISAGTKYAEAFKVIKIIR
jgi:LmbE family N-acetylglucosaminyl deacetylase